MRLYELSVLDQIVLAIIGEKPQHGFAVSKELERDVAREEKQLHERDESPQRRN